MNLWNQTYQVKASTVRASGYVLGIGAFYFVWAMAGLYSLERLFDITPERQFAVYIGFMLYMAVFVIVSNFLMAAAKSYITSQRVHDSAMVKTRALRSELNQAQEAISNSDVSLLPVLNDAAIVSPTLSRLQNAITEFPSHYPNYDTRQLKLDDDIRPWLKSAGYAKNDREAFVFGSIIAERYEL